jgi:hypothetical protein
MKKLIAISIVLTLAASVAFAELTVGGQVGIGVTVISGNSDDAPLGVGASGGGRIDAVYANDEGSFGAFVRVKPLNAYDSGTDRVFAWWQPLSQLKLTLGVDGNGQFGINYIVGWGWHANDAEDFVALNGYGNTRNAWSYGGFGDLGAVLTLTPIDGLAINVAVPYNKSTKAEDTYNHITGQLTYNITDIGEIGVTYVSGAGYRGFEAKGGTWSYVNDWDNSTEHGMEWKESTISQQDPGAIHAQFYLTAVQNLQLNIGAKYTFAGDIGEGTSKTTYTPAIAAGFGLNYNVSDTIGVKARLFANFIGSEKTGDVTINDPLKLGFDLMPYFDLSILKLFLNLGIEYADKTEWIEPGKTEVTKKDDSQIFSWYVNPYITKSAGGGTFYAGFQLSSNGAAKDAVISWGVPIGIQIGF